MFHKENIKNRNLSLRHQIPCTWGVTKKKGCYHFILENCITTGWLFRINEPWVRSSAAIWGSIMSSSELSPCQFSQSAWQGAVSAPVLWLCWGGDLRPAALHQSRLPASPSQGATNFLAQSPDLYSFPGGGVLALLPNSICCDPEPHPGPRSPKLAPLSLSMTWVLTLQSSSLVVVFLLLTDSLLEQTSVRLLGTLFSTRPGQTCIALC